MWRSGGRRGEKRREQWSAQNCRNSSHRRLAWPKARHRKASRARAGWAPRGARGTRNRASRMQEIGVGPWPRDPRVLIDEG